MFTVDVALYQQLSPEARAVYEEFELIRSKRRKKFYKFFSIAQVVNELTQKMMADHEQSLDSSSRLQRLREVEEQSYAILDVRKREIYNF
jgi:hypothetical protein